MTDLTLLTPAEAEMRALAEAAMPGPWFNSLSVKTTNGEIVCTAADRAYIAAANPQAVLALLDALAAAREALQQIADCPAAMSGGMVWQDVADRMERYARAALPPR